MEDLLTVEFNLQMLEVKFDFNAVLFSLEERNLKAFEEEEEQ